MSIQLTIVFTEFIKGRNIKVISVRSGLFQRFATFAFVSNECLELVKTWDVYLSR